MISKKNLVDSLSHDRLNLNVINFIFGYIHEKFIHEMSRNIMIRDENRLLLYPIEFYSELTKNSPLVK